MGRLGPGKRKAFFLYVIAFVSFFVLALPLVQVTEVVVDGVEYLFPKDGEVFITLEYLHSVELFRVVETYLIAGCEIRLVEFRWSGYGAGLPSTPEDIFSQISQSGGEFIARNISVISGNVLRLDMKHRVGATVSVNGEIVSSNVGVEVRVCVRVSLAKILHHLLTPTKLPISSGNQQHLRAS